MAEEKFILQVITPLGVEVDAQVLEVEVPAADGEIGFLPKHIPYAGILGIGVMRYKLITGEEKRLVLRKGFCSFTKGKLMILADATRSNPATPEELAQQEILNTQMSAATDPAQWALLQSSLKEIEASQLL